jgi:hypothetical protein
MKRIVKILLVFVYSLSGMILLASGEKDSSLLFRADFDSYSVNADYGKGDTKCYSFKNPDLQLRMFPGIKDKGNAVCLVNSENCTYKLPGNFDPRQGTVSMWVSPQNWKVSSKKWQKFFSVYSNDFQLVLYKYMWPNNLMFYLRYPNAPGKKKIFTAMTMLNDTDWTPGKWHKLDITWDSRGMKLYVDGIMPKVYHKNSRLRIPFYKFQTPLKFPDPEKLKNSYLTFGMDQGGRKHHATDLSHRTAYDDIKIYNRPLSPAEIRNAYEKYFPCKLTEKVRRPIITIPKTKGEVKIDGIINTSEWSDAGLVPVAGFLGKPLPGVSAKAYYKYDDKYLYIGMSANRACKMIKNYRSHDDKLWEEDSFELILQSPKKNLYHFIINGNGVVYDEQNTIKKWNSSARSAAWRGKNTWSAELAIPLEKIGGKLAGQTWEGNFGATYYTNTGHYSGWSKILYSYADPKSFGIIRFGRDGSAVRLKSFGDLTVGALDLAVEVVPKNKTPQVLISAKSTEAGGNIISFPGQLAGKTWKTNLPAGKQNLQIEGTSLNRKELVFLLEKYIYVNFPLEIEYTCWAKRKYIEVNIDLNNSGDENLKAITKKGLKGTVELIDNNGHVFSEKSFLAKKMNFDVKLKLPENLSPGKYHIVAKVTGIKSQMKRSALFQVPDMTPYKKRVALDHTVPAPWQKVISVRNNLFKILDREYSFDKGPFPCQVVSRGKKLLQSPIIMKYNGQPVKWSNFKVIKKYPDVIKLSGRGIAGEAAFKWQGELWFDGLYKLNLAMSPDGSKAVSIKSLNISWTMPSEFAKFVLSPLHNKWVDNQVLLMPNPPTTSTREHLLWLTGHLRGLMWWPESNANWVNRKNEKPIVISRKNGTVSASLNIITRPAELKKTAVYKMAFMGTPAKNPPKDFRKFHADGFGRPKGQNAQHMGWGSFYNKFSDSDTTSPASHLPRDPKAYQKAVQNWRSKGIAPFTYAMPGQISSRTAEYDYFMRTWATLPSHVHRLTKGGVKYKLQRCCGNTGVADLFAWRAEQLFKQFPDLGGLYYDVGAAGFCQNAEHGHGGIDAFGQPYISSGAMALRDLLMRIYKIHNKYGKIFFYHCHSYFNPVCHTFTDYFYPGEQYYRTIAKNYQHAYCEEISLDEYQSELNGKIKGVGLQFLPQYGRAAHGIKSLNHLAKDFQRNPEWAIRTITPMLLHDVNVSAAYIDREVTVPRLWKAKDDANFKDAEFAGYWTNPGVKSASPKVLVSVYRWKKPAPYKVVLAVGNLGRTEQPAALKCDFKRLGIDDPKEYFDLWNKRKLNAGDLKTRKIKGNHFMLVGIK